MFFYIILYNYFIFQYCLASQANDWPTQFQEKINNTNHADWILDQISEDLKNFKNSVVLKKNLEKATNNHNFKLAKINITNGKLSVTHKGNDIDPNCLRLPIIIQAIENILKYSQLPNLDFIITVSDGFTGNSDQFNCPIFAFSKNKILDRNTVLFPDIDSLHWNQLLINEVKSGIQKYPWNKKIGKAFWRGTASEAYYTINTMKNFTRFKLVQISIMQPDYLDAKFSTLYNVDQEVKNYFISRGYYDKHISIPEHLIYKYQILIDGGTSAWARAYWQLFSDTLILKVDSDNIQWYYRNLMPYVHYIPIKKDLSDLISQIQWSSQNDNITRQIIGNANNFANNNLSYADMLYYIYILLIEYSKLQHK